MPSTLGIISSHCTRPPALSMVRFPANPGSYIYTPKSLTFNTGSSLTLECFFVPSGSTRIQLFCYGNGQPYGNAIVLDMLNTNQFRFSQPYVDRFTTTKTFSRNRVYHVALVLDTNARLYINGLLEGSSTFGYGSGTYRALFHSWWDNVGFYSFGDTCWASNYRITNGSLYTGTSTTTPNFIVPVPTTPLTSNSSTVLLTLVNGSTADLSNNMYVMTNVNTVASNWP